MGAVVRLEQLRRFESQRVSYDSSYYNHPGVAIPPRAGD